MFTLTYFIKRDLKYLIGLTVQKLSYLIGTSSEKTQTGGSQIADDPNIHHNTGQLPDGGTPEIPETPKNG